MVGKLLYEGAFCGLYCGLFCVKIEYKKKNRQKKDMIEGQMSLEFRR